MTEESLCPPEPILERHLAGELSPSSKHAAHVASCPLCAARVARMRADGDAYTASEAAASLRRRLSDLDRAATRRRRAAAWVGLGFPLAAAAAWLLVLRGPAPGDLTPKGEGAVQLLVGRGGNVGAWSGGALLPGDVLQLSWTSREAAYVAVVGREDGGATERWFPAGAAHGEQLAPGARPFGDGLRFDPPFRGTVYVFVADRQFDTGPLEDAVRAGRDPAFSGKTSELRVPPP